MCKRIVETRPIFYLSLTTIYYLYPFCRGLFCYLINIFAARASNSGYGSHGVSLPSTLIKIKVNKSFHLHNIISLLCQCEWEGGRADG